MQVHTDTQQKGKKPSTASKAKAMKPKTKPKINRPIRHMRIQSLSRQSQGPGVYYENYVYPALRLWGKWLQEAGFTSGSHVSIEVKKDRLTIKKIKEEHLGR